jgi:hypothetical protein
MASQPPDEPIDQYEPYDEAEEEQYADRRYRAVSPLAVLSLACGALSFLTVFGWFFGLLPAAGIVLAWLAIRRISRSPEEIQGWSLALAGLGLSVVLWAGGSIGLTIRQRYLIPTGYKPVSFGDLQRDKSKPNEMIPPAAVELDGERIFIQGYMYPGRQVFHVKEFIMVPSSGLCKFCITSIEPTQMIRVEMVGDLTADYKTSISGVGGKLKVDPKVTLGSSPYLIEADVFR